MGRGDGLGRDFWMFRSGQLASVLGEGCGTVAVSWWILERVGTGGAVATAIAPALAARTLLLPLFGPLADRMSRRKMLIAADAARGAALLAVFAMALSGAFSLPIVTALLVLSGACGAAFQAAASGIVAELVRRDQLPSALRQTQALQSLGTVAGGACGAMATTALGVSGALALNAACLFAASAFTWGVSLRTQARGNGTGVAAWARELGEGVMALRRVPVLFWLCIIAMLMNFTMAPLSVTLPLLARETSASAPWFLGAMEAALGLGAVLGALGAAPLEARFGRLWVLIGGCAGLGFGLALIPLCAGFVAPLAALVAIGAAGGCANVALGTQLILALPDEFRGRIGSLTGFLCGGMAPLGVAGAGWLVELLGLGQTFYAMAGGMLVATPAMLLIPRFAQFMRADADTVSRYWAI